MLDLIESDILVENSHIVLLPTPIVGKLLKEKSVYCLSYSHH